MASHKAFDQVRPRDAVRIYHQAKGRSRRSNSNVSRRAGKGAPVKVNESNRRELTLDYERSLIDGAINDNYVVSHRRALIE
jgi:hypothetical protein